MVKKISLEVIHVRITCKAGSTDERQANGHKKESLDEGG